MNTQHINSIALHDQPRYRFRYALEGSRAGPTPMDLGNNSSKATTRGVTGAITRLLSVYSLVDGVCTTRPRRVLSAVFRP